MRLPRRSSSRGTWRSHFCFGNLRRIIQISSITFVVFYVIAALLYPFTFNPTKRFFCDLMSPDFGCEPIINQGFPFALLALISITVFIISFFVWFTNQTNWSTTKKLITKTGGVTSALFTLFIFTDFHDQFILIASIIGILPVAFVSIEMVKNWKAYNPILGFISFGFLFLYNVIFYAGAFETSWPTMQKVSILLCLIWVNSIVAKSKT